MVQFCFVIKRNGSALNYSITRECERYKERGKREMGLKKKSTDETTKFNVIDTKVLHDEAFEELERQSIDGGSILVFIFISMTIVCRLKKKKKNSHFPPLFNTNHDT